MIVPNYTSTCMIRNLVDAQLFQLLVLLDFKNFLFSNWMGIKWYLTVILICTLLITDDCLAFYICFIFCETPTYVFACLLYTCRTSFYILNTSIL